MQRSVLSALHLPALGQDHSALDELVTPLFFDQAANFFAPATQARAPNVTINIVQLTVS